MAPWKKLLLVCIALVALASPGVIPTSPTFTSGVCAANTTRYYYVYYRASPRDAWHYYGYTNNAATAAYYVRYLQSYGYQAYYR